MQHGHDGRRIDPMSNFQPEHRLPPNPFCEQLNSSLVTTLNTMEAARADCAIELFRVARVASLTTAVQRAVMASSSSKTVARNAAEIFTHWALRDKNDEALEGLASMRVRVLPVDVTAKRCVQTPHGRVGTLERFLMKQRRQVVVLFADNSEGEEKEEVRDLAELRLVGEGVALDKDPLVPLMELEAPGGVMYQRVLRTMGNHDNNNMDALMEEMGRWSMEARRAIAEKRMELGKSGPPPLAITVLHDNTSKVTFTCGDSFSCSLLLSYYEKLKCLYRGDIKEEGDAKEVFHLRVVTMLARYHALAGAIPTDTHTNAGFHASVHPDLSIALKRHLSVTAECFANPLNTNTLFFCSLFPDTDRWFGSVGSFFGFSPSEGSYHCNPPFDVTIVERTARRLQSMLDSTSNTTSTTPLSFFVVVHHTDHDKMDSTLDAFKNKYLRQFRLLPRESATYVDGHAHTSETPCFTLRGGTLALLLQNDAAQRLWPSATVLKAVLGVWASVSLPSSKKREPERGDNEKEAQKKINNNRFSALNKKGGGKK